MIIPEKNKYSAICFLDVDGVLNHELFYKERYKHLTKFRNVPLYKTVKKHLRKLLKTKEISDFDYYKGEIDENIIKLLNDICEELNMAVVLSASMRLNNTVEKLQEIFNYCGATFTIIDKTPYTGYERGTEISKWLKENCNKWFDVNYYDFYNFIIIDDDSDFLISQAPHLFQCDNYSGLTPTICYKIKQFLTHKTF